MQRMLGVAQGRCQKQMLLGMSLAVLSVGSGSG